MAARHRCIQQSATRPARRRRAPVGHRQVRRWSALAGVASLVMGTAVSWTVIASVTTAHTAAAAQSSCPTPAALRNGSFESPAVAAGAANLVPASDPNLVWNTTAADGQVEYWRNGGDTDTVNAGLAVTAQTGAQWAELNATQAGQLYQDVATVPGQVMRWSLWHRGRNVSGEPADGTDVMKVAIGAPGGELDQIPDGATGADIADTAADWVRYTGSYLIPPGQTTTRFAMVAVSAFGGDLTSGNFVDNVSFSSGPCLLATKSATNTNPAHGSLVEPGDTLRYTVGVTNGGADTASAASISDVIPAGTSYVPGSLMLNSTAVTDAGGDDQGEFSAVDKRVNVRVGSGADETSGGALQPNGAASMTFDVTLDPSSAVGTSISNAATASYTWAPDGTVLDSTSSTALSTVVTTGITLSKTITGTTDANLDGRLDAGDGIGYQFEVHNTGSTDLTELAIADPKLSVSCPATDLASGGQLLCTGSYQITQADVDSDTGLLVNTATASGTPPGGAATITSAADSASQPIARNPNFAQTKSLDQGSYIVGQAIVYTVTVTNNGGGSGTAVLADAVPAAVSLATVTCSATAGGLCDTAGSAGSAVAGSMTIPAGGTVTYTLTGVVASAGILKNTAVISATTPGCTNQCGGGDAVTGAVLAAGAPQFSITKTADRSSYLVGGAIRYTVSVTNSGQGPGSASIADAVPSVVGTVTVSCAAGSGATCDTVGSSGNLVHGRVSIGAGGTVIYTIAGVLTGVGDAGNTVTLDPTGSEGTPGCDTQCGGGTATTPPLPVAANPFFTASKTADQSHYLVGQPITYTISVANTGAGSGVVRVEDAVPATVSLTSFSCGASGAGTCDTIGTVGANLVGHAAVPAGESAIFTIVGMVRAAGSVANSALVTPTTDGCTAQCGGGLVTTAGLSSVANPVFAATKTADKNAYIVGETILYTISITNTGLGDGTASLFDKAPDRVAVSSLTCTTTGGATCTTAWTSGNLVTEAVSIPAGGSVTYTMSALITSSGVLTNLASVDPDRTAANPNGTPGCAGQCGGGSVSTALILAANNPIFTQSNSTDSSSYIVGQPITYTIEITNAGGGRGKATMTDPVPAAVTVTGVVCSPSTGGSCTTGLPSNHLTGFVMLPGGGRVSYTINGFINAPGDVTNTASVLVTTLGCSTQCGGGQAQTAALTALDKPLFTETKTADKPTYNVGDPILYTITVANAGLGGGSAGISDAVPGSVTVDAVDCAADPSSSCDTAGSTANTLSGAVRIGAGGSVVYTVRGRVSGTGDVANTVTVDPAGTNLAGTAGCLSQCGGGTASTEALPAAPTADLAVAKSVDPPVLTAGLPLTYTAALTNRGPNSALGVVTLDPIPAAVQNPAGTPDPGVSGASCLTRATTQADLAKLDPASGPYSIDSYPRLVECRYPSLPVRGTVISKIVGTVDPAAMPGSQVRDQLIAFAATHDPDLGNNSSTTVASTTSLADLSLTKTITDSQVVIGGDAHFTVTIHNDGPSVARGVLALDAPTGLTPTSGVASAGRYEVSSGSWSLGQLAVGATATLSLVQRVDATNASNTAGITATDTPDPNGANDGGSTSCVQSATGCGHVAVQVVDAPLAHTGAAAIRASQAALVLLFGGVALMLLGRRRRSSSIG
jgi:uncharacterized repeat protein (TIGR01451 family)